MQYQRTPLNLDISQLFQLKPNQGTEPIQRKKSLSSLSKSMSKDIDAAHDFRRHTTQPFNPTSNFVFRERDKVLRSVINATEPSQRESY